MFVRPVSGHRHLACAHPAAGERRRWLRQDSSAADRRARRVASSVSGTTLATGDDPREGLPQANTNGAIGVTPSRKVMNGRKRRGSLTRDRRGGIAFDSVPLFGPTSALKKT